MPQTTKERIRSRKVTRAFKMDEGLDREIVNRAKKIGITPSSLVSQVLLMYIEWGQYLGKGSNFLTLDTQVFQLFLQELDEEKIIDIARTSALVSTHDFLKFRYRTISFETVLNFLENFSSYGNIGEANIIRTEQDRLETNFRHSLGIKWSIFLSEYVQGMLSSFIDMQTSGEVSPFGCSIIALKKKPTA